jgi:hypothetical protein
MYDNLVIGFLHRDLLALVAENWCEVNRFWETQQNRCALPGIETYTRGELNRDIRDTSTLVEVRFLSGNCTWFPYSWIGPWRHDPGEGLLLKVQATSSIWL